MNRLCWVLVFLILGCKSTPEQFVYSSGALKQDNDVFLQQVQAQQYTKAELVAVAQQVLKNGRCDKALLLAQKFQLSVNMRSDYQTLFQCLMQKRQFDLAEQALAFGAEPVFIAVTDAEQNNALVQAAAHGQVSLVKALIRRGEIPGKAAFYAGITADVHRDPKLSLQLLALFKPYVNRAVLRYRSGDAPVLYQLLSNQFLPHDVIPLVQELLQLGVLPDDGQQRNAVHPVGASFPYKDTPLLLVAESSELAAILRKAGADPTARAKRQRAERLAALRTGMTIPQGLITDIRPTGVQLQNNNGSHWLDWRQLDI